MNPFRCLNLNPDLALKPNHLAARAAGLRLGLRLRSAVAGLIVLLFAGSAHAQWLTQSIDLKPGWNAVFLHVDASYETLQTLVADNSANPIQEIWLWDPAPASAQFIDSPQQPTSSGSQWSSWVRSASSSSALQRLIGNAAYLVRVSSTVASYQWQLQGKPVPPHYQWTSSGVNLLGFPTTPASPPSFEAFLTENPALLQGAEIFRYIGGDLGPSNPERLFALRTTPLRRGEAFWIRSGDLFNRYFGPLEIVLQDPAGVHFGSSLGQHRLRLKNLAPRTVTITLNLLPSEASPAGQDAITGTPPILRRGDINLSTLTYGYSSLNAGPQQWTLTAQGQPGSEVEVILGLNRSQMAGTTGQLSAGILRFSDSLGLSQVDIGISARVASKAGLWIGNASLNQVRHYLKSYARDATGAPVSSGNGQYQVTDTKTNYGTVSRNFPLRLVVHNDQTDRNAVLLQRVYYGVAPDKNLILATKEALLDPGSKDTARRISSSHLPWSETNTPWSFTGEFRQGMTVKATVSVSHNDQSSNPFLHTYHPDHDNLDATFDGTLPQGYESYLVSREVTLTLTAPANDFSSLTGSGQTLTGEYEEVITFNGRGSESRRFDVKGPFSLNRIVDIPTLKTQ